MWMNIWIYLPKLYRKDVKRTDLDVFILRLLWFIPKTYKKNEGCICQLNSFA